MNGSGELGRQRLDEYVSPQVRKVGRGAYALTVVGTGVLFLGNWAGSQILFGIGAVVFLPSFAVAWILTMYVFGDWTIGSYLRYRRDRARRRG